MRTRQELIDACLELPGVYEDYPFDDANWTVMRHGAGRRSFALIFERNGQLWVNLKVEPMDGLMWRQTFSAVVPAYHMNKEHWISVILDGTMPDGAVMRLVEDSYRLTQAKRASKKPRRTDEA